MTTHRFDTPKPIELFTEIGRGSVAIRAADTSETLVEITGRDADEVAVRQDGDAISVVGPRQRPGFLGGDRLDVAVTLPARSGLTVRTGSADITVRGPVAGGRIKSGSGDVALDTADGPLLVETGSGTIRLETVRGELKAKSGSGDVLVADADAGAAISTGSGDVRLRRIGGPVVVKTGSGDLEVGDAGGDVAMTTGSGDLVVGRVARGRVTHKGASGDVQLGVPAGVPVWTDISTVSGEIRCNLTGAGQPRDGVAHLEVRAKTVSGDVVLAEV
jgi:DUF4097 and DUF4098 domain-containing protein YvlB